MIGESWRRPRYPAAVAGGAAPRMMGLRSHLTPHGRLLPGASIAWLAVSTNICSHVSELSRGGEGLVCVLGGREELAVVTVVESRS